MEVPNRFPSGEHSFYMHTMKWCFYAVEGLQKARIRKKYEKSTHIAIKHDAQLCHGCLYHPSFMGKS